MSKIGNGIRVQLAGKRFGRFVVLAESARNKHGQRMWACRCDCGNEKTVTGFNLTTGCTKSCGCNQRDKARERNTKHGNNQRGKRTGAYTSWAAMLDRCRNSSCPTFAEYGGRGISVCARWLSFDRFVEDMGDRPLGTSLDRVDVNGNYEPGNCRWATATQQARNQRRTKFSPHEPSQIRWLILECGYSNGDVADAFGVSRQLIHQIVKNKIWQDVGGSQ